ncbi:hypothetical protein ACWGLF_46530 [Streptomyces puniciscabiei]
MHLRQEYDLAAARTMGHYCLKDIAQDNARGRAFTHHQRALHSLAGAAEDYERRVGMLAWRHAAAEVVLGTTLLDRLVRGGEPLSLKKINLLCEEPTLGKLREALSIPAADLLIAGHKSMVDRAEKRRTLLLDRVKMIFQEVASLQECRDDPSDGAVSARRLTEASPAGGDPLYKGALEVLMPYAEALPFDIRYHLRHSTGAGVRARLRQ